MRELTTTDQLGSNPIMRETNIIRLAEVCLLQRKIAIHKDALAIMEEGSRYHTAIAEYVRGMETKWSLLLSSFVRNIARTLLISVFSLELQLRVRVSSRIFKGGVKTFTTRSRAVLRSSLNTASGSLASLPVSTIACTPQYDPILFWLKLSLTVLPSLGKFKVHSLILIPCSLIKKNKAYRYHMVAVPTSFKGS